MHVLATDSPIFIPKYSKLNKPSDYKVVNKNQRCYSVDNCFLILVNKSAQSHNKAAM